MKFLELKLPPVLQVAVIGAGMWGLAQTVPTLRLELPGASWLAFLLAGIGMLFGIMGVIEFRKANTTIDPLNPQKAAHLVDTGIFRLSRNPMYFGLLLLLIGWAFYLAHALPFLLVPLFIVSMTRFQIVPEERAMEERFGDAYRGYTRRVRRWI